MASERAWSAALVEHDAAVADCLAAIRGVSPARWQRPRPGGRWSPAAEALHVALAYEFGVDAVTSGAAMRLVVPPAAAWVARRLLLPLLRRTRTFPRGAPAPPEVWPSAVEARALSIDEAGERVAGGAVAAARALRDADGRRPAPRVTHANFGPLSPLEAMHLLGVHTRHHARSLASAGHTGAAQP